MKVERIKDLLLGKESKGSSIVLTRQELVNKIYKHFVTQMEDETTDVGLLFHTSFFIYLNENDYIIREQSFAYTVKDVMKKIDEKVHSMRKQYPDYRPHSKYWQFQFVPFKDGGIVNNPMGDTLKKIDPKDVVIFSFIHPDSLYLSENESERVVATVHVKDSVAINKWAINREALRGIDATGKDRFRVPFKDDVSPREMPISVAESLKPEANAKAILTVEQCSFVKNGQISKRYYMVSDYLQISGRNDVENRGGMDVAKLDSDEVLNPHLTIKTDSLNSTFFLSAIGDVMLNEVRVPQDASKWTTLPNNSTLLLNGEIQLIFKISK